MISANGSCEISNCFSFFWSFLVCEFLVHRFWRFSVSPRFIWGRCSPNLTTVHIFQNGLGKKPPTQFVQSLKFLGDFPFWVGFSQVLPLGFLLIHPRYGLRKPTNLQNLHMPILPGRWTWRCVMSGFVELVS